MFVQILATSTIRNVWKTVRRICMLILGLKGSTLTVTVKPPYADIIRTGGRVLFMEVLLLHIQ